MYLRFRLFPLQQGWPLKQEERDKIIPHPIVGVRLIQKMDVAFEELLRACFEHHERLDGSGLSAAHQSSQSTKPGRLCAVADSFAAMICRPFRRAKIFFSLPKSSPTIRAMTRKWQTRCLAALPLLHGQMVNARIWQWICRCPNSRPQAEQIVK